MEIAGQKLSASGYKRTSRLIKSMSAFPPKADVGNHHKIQFVARPESHVGALRQPWAGV